MGENWEKDSSPATLPGSLFVGSIEMSLGLNVKPLSIIHTFVCEQLMCLWVIKNTLEELDPIRAKSFLFI